MGQAESRALNSNDKVFEKKAKYGTNRVIYLEDLVDLIDVVPQTNIKIAKVRLRFYEWAHRTRDEFESSYRRAIENLQKAAPNLKELRIDGCYAHKPECSNSESGKAMESEAKLLQNRLEGLLYAWRGCSIKLYRIEFNVHWVLNESSPPLPDFQQIGLSTFGPKTQTKQSSNKQVQWTYYFEDTAIFITFHFDEEHKQGTLTPGRCSWPRY